MIIIEGEEEKMEKSKRILYLLVFAFFLAIYFAGTSFGYELERYRLKNGLVVILLPDNKTPAVAMNVWVSVGGFNESDGESGMSHFVEHLIFKGTSELGPGEGAAILEASGGTFNAYTTFDNTVYTAACAGRFVETMIEVVGDSVLNASFPKGEVQSEQQVILEEIRMNLDDPTRRITKLMFAKSFAGHPYGDPILGTMEEVGKYTKDELYDYYKTYYVPSNMALVLSGDFDPKAVKPMIERYFGDAPKVDVPKRPSYEYPQDKGLSVDGLYENVHIGYLDLGFNIPPIDHEDLYALDVASQILGEGMGSRLYVRLVDEEKLVYHIGTYSYTPRQAGLFLVTSLFSPEKLEESVKVIMEEFTKLKVGSVTKQELDGAKIKIKSDFIYGEETVEGLADTIGFFEAVLGDVRFEKKYIKRIEGVSAEDIGRVANKYFVPENLTVTYLLPKDNESVSLNEDVSEAALSGFSYEVGGDVSGGVEMISGPMGHVATLENGIKLIIKEDHTLPVVAVVSAFEGGLRHEDENNNGINNLISHMITRGTKDLTAKKITELARGTASGFSGFSGKNTFGLEAEFLKEYEDEGWDLLSDIIQNPSFDSDELAKVKEEALAEKDAEKDDLVTTTVRLFKKALYKDHPYSMPDNGTEKNIELLTRDDLIRYYETFAVPSNMVIAVVGDVDAGGVLMRVRELFGDFSGEEFRPSEVPSPEKPNSPIEARKETHDKEQAHIFFGFLGSDLLSSDYYKLEVLSAVLSGHGGRLFSEIREKLGLAYAVDAFNIGGLDRGFFGVYLATEPKNITRVKEEIKAELMKVKEDGVTLEELERAKNYIVGNYELSLQKNIDMARNMAIYELYGLGYDYPYLYPEKIFSVTEEDILNTADEYIDFGSMVISVVSPAF